MNTINVTLTGNWKKRYIVDNDGIPQGYIVLDPSGAIRVYAAEVEVFKEGMHLGRIMEWVGNWSDGVKLQLTQAHLKE